MPSVLRPWVMELPLREQGTLLAAIRGCDTAPKNPLDSPERQLTAYLRWVVMVPADSREVGLEPGAFMQDSPPVGWRPSALGHYPLHYVTHLMHAYEVVAYRCPDVGVAEEALLVYTAFAESLHLLPEPFSKMHLRLSEDRIAAGTVVQ